MNCVYFGKCGGCSAQHIPYDLQLENKKKVLLRSVKFEPIQVFSDDPFNYRNRMDLIFHQGGLGFREKGKWYQTVDVAECKISNPKLNKLIKEVRDFFKSPDAFNLKTHAGTLRYAVIRTPQEDSSISFVLNEESTRIAEAIEKIKEFSKITSAKNIIITYIHSKTDNSISNDFFVVKGEDMLTESYLDKTFKYSVQGFFQNNHVLAEKMIKYVKQLLTSHKTSDSTLLDLYGGVGSFGIVCEELFKKTVVVEGDKNCIAAANLNIKLNDSKNTEAVFLNDKQLKNLDLPDDLFVVTDPPRSGMHPKTIEQLNRLKPKVIVYVSCNLQQLGKDLPKFKNYQIKSAALFDLFPQTPHCEGVVELVRNSF